ncbi:RNA-directed RNA polymerase QDE-1 [Moesziomyces antarcticus T-34]|uniref:RNA-dependent RNA polymerase n=1 Tax=Pseudozyma antarctica (strain T-34) TaxID=1151754 RepID=M9MCI2_PSEA3|nr:RNA-directed RNA polymerase QDE-1 [Moesziomyces antarcticus T-34]
MTNVVQQHLPDQHHRFQHTDASPSKRTAVDQPKTRHHKSRKSSLSSLDAPTSPPRPTSSKHSTKLKTPSVADISSMSSSESDTDSYKDMLVPEDWDATPTSSQSTDNSSLSPRLATVPAECAPPVSPSEKDVADAQQQAPLWALFREDFDESGAPDRIYLPLARSEQQIARAKAPDPLRSAVEPPKVAVEPSKGALIRSIPSAPGPSATFSSEEPPFTATAEPKAVSHPRQHLGKPPLPPFNVVDGKMRIKIMQKQKDGRPGVPWGVQFFLASLASFGLLGFEELDITAGINTIRAETNLAAICALYHAANQRILWQSEKDEVPFLARQATKRELQLAQEQDREAEMLSVSRLDGVLGPPGEDMRTFGGRVIFHGRISCTNNPEGTKAGKKATHLNFKVQLLPPKLGGSCRFARRFGSENILRLTMDRSLAREARRFPLHPKTREKHQEISDFFGRTLQILGRRFRPFICKDDIIFYLCIGSPGSSSAQPEFDCVWDFVDHHAPFAANGSSQLGKFIQRIQLGLSTSVPASTIDTITYVSDLRGDPHPVTGEQVIMTDGAATMSLAVARDVAQRLSLTSVPSAIQARVAGAKGVWYLDPNAQSWLPGEEPKRWIHIRKSQNKIEYPRDEPRDLSQQVLDLLTASRTTSPSSLSKQIILVLHSNGVPTETFAALQQAELRAITDSISNWEGPDLLVSKALAKVVDDLCQVEKLRAKRSTEAAEHRAQGMGLSDSTQMDTVGDDRDFFFEKGRHIWNGMPLSKPERAHDMLKIGFHPRSCSYLAGFLVEIADTAMKKVTQRFAVSIARSAEAMVIPDPTGTLEEGEIQFRFSGDSICDPDSRLALHHVPEGDVLVTRHPCLLPTDIRKVRAVVRSELSRFQDVVVFSTKGHTPLASLLSGGDYDGDLIRVFWEPRLVDPFKNADIKFAECPFEMDKVFNRSEETVSEFVAQHNDKNKEERDRGLVERLVAGAFDPQVRGLYGVMHLYAAWQFGIESEQAVDLAHKFCQCMDGSKTGLTIKAEVRIADSKKYFGKLPAWAYDAGDPGDRHDWFADEDCTPIGAVKNSQQLESVLCTLWVAGKEEAGRLKTRLHQMTEKLRGVEDMSLSGLWKQAKDLGQIRPEEEEAIRNHVKVMEESYVLTNSRTRREIENRNRGLQAKAVLKSRQERSAPLRRVRSEASSKMGSGAREKLLQGTAVDDLESSDMMDRLDETVEVPVVLDSASEVAMRFCQWPKAFAEQHIAKMDKAAVERLEMLRASYAYSVTYASKPRFAFEMAWRWLLNFKAEAAGSAGTRNHDASTYSPTPGRGCMQVPYSTLDVLCINKKTIARSIESARNGSFEV